MRGSTTRPSSHHRPAGRRQVAAVPPHAIDVLMGRLGGAASCAGAMPSEAFPVSRISPMTSARRFIADALRRDARDLIRPVDLPGLPSSVFRTYLAARSDAVGQAHDSPRLASLLEQRTRQPAVVAPQRRPVQVVSSATPRMGIPRRSEQSGDSMMRTRDRRGVVEHLWRVRPDGRRGRWRRRAAPAQASALGRARADRAPRVERGACGLAVEHRRPGVVPRAFVRWVARRCYDRPSRRRYGGVLHGHRRPPHRLHCPSASARIPFLASGR